MRKFKSKKMFALIMCALLTFFSVVALTACGEENEAAKADGDTLVIKVRRAGFGTDWLYELKGKFEAAYQDKGYKVLIMTPDNAISSSVLINELALGYENTNVDLYISTTATPDQVGAQSQYGGVLVEDIEESVYDQKAISYDGSEEEKTVREKINADIIPCMTDSAGNLYGYCWAQASSGVVVNTRKLAAYGLEIPKTTNEMFDCFDKIYCGYNGIPNSIESGTYPITYVSGSNGYSLFYLYGLMAQYGVKEYEKFWTFQTTDETGAKVNLTDAECQDLFDSEMIQEMMKVAYKTFDMNIAAPGSASQGVDQAQAKIMGDVDGAVFMFNGEWMLNEVKLNYPDELEDIDFIKVPVMSSIGTKVFGQGTSYNFSDEKCEELLSFIIGLVDQNVELDEIINQVKQKKNVEISEEDAMVIINARGVVAQRGPDHVAYITKGTPKKEIASLFLRMMASDDFGETFARTANGSSPYCAYENTTSPYVFVRNASKILTNRYYTLVTNYGGTKGYRGQIGGALINMFTTQNHVPNYITASSTATIYTMMGSRNGDTDKVYEDAAKKFLAEEKANVIKNWQNYLTAAGL